MTTANFQLSFSGNKATERTADSAITLNVCTLVETGNPAFMIDYNRIGAAIDVAIKHANENILPKNLRISKIYKNAGTECAAVPPIIRRTMEIIQEGVVCNIYIGPGCSESALDAYKIAVYQKVPLIAVPGSNLIARTGRARADFQYLIRTSYVAVGIARALVAFLDYGNYTHFTIIVNRENMVYSEILDGLTGIFKTVRPDLLTTMDIVYVDYDRSNNQSTSPAKGVIKLGTELEALNKTCRVIVVLANANSVRRVMVRAYNIGMAKGEHVYIGVELFPSDTWGRFTWQRDDKDDEVARLAFRSLVLISMTKIFSSYMEDFSDAIRDLALKKYGYTFGVFDQVDPIILGFYDAFILYARTMERLHNSGANFTDGLTVAQAMWNTTVRTPLGTEIVMSSIGDKVISYDVRIFTIERGSHTAFLRIDGSSNQLTWLNTLIWPSEDGTLPPDVPKCGYSGLNCRLDADDTTKVVLGTVIPIVVVLGAFGAAVYYVLMKNQHNLDPNWWRYKMDELIFPQDRVGSRIGSGKNMAASQSMGTTLNSKSKASKATYLSTVCPWTSAICNGNVIGLKLAPEKTYRPTQEVIKELIQIQPIRHANLQRFIGLCLDDLGWVVYEMGEFCQKGCLDDLIDQKSLNLDWSFKFSLLNDIAEGMNQLHLSPVESHGFLRSLVCLIDGRLSVKVSDYGITKLRNPDALLPFKEGDSMRECEQLLWRAPELLRVQMPPKGSQKGDVYSFAIIMQQIILRSGPYESPGGAQNQMMESTVDLLLEIKKGTSPPIRPPVARSACSVDLFNLMENCWSEFPVQRPSFLKIKESIAKMGGISGGNLIDHLIKRMEKYATDLEEQVATKTQQFMEEKDRSEQLLSQMLPKAVALCLVKGESVHPEFFEMVTVYFSDIVGFTSISASGTPMDVISLLNELYTLFDEIVEKHDAYKVETTGDAYMVASGLPLRNGNIHAVEVATVACETLMAVQTVSIPHRPHEHLRIRCGIHSGSCVAGIIGLKAPRYCLFGDSINTASRMESTGEPMKVQTTQSTKDLLTEMQSDFKITLRGQVDVKGKGQMTTYWLTR
ncbi:Atrial natriuretic peptide receptor 1 [Hypsibius exemplaris]|uniref:Guanylate cyclase n=1 Tax=Hypsibius exemplaris TaxID=2072580 RepID=A0A1W0WYG1_HYPEX|nr:Atrial natriuretic peptide receptor 1 [Hypsibius exemplaris]